MYVRQKKNICDVSMRYYKNQLPAKNTSVFTMASVLNFVACLFTVVMVYGQDNDHPLQPQQNSQIYSKDNFMQVTKPVMEYSQNPQPNPTSTTVCVELKNGPSNPYAVCGPQLSTGLAYQNTKDSIKIPLPLQHSQGLQPFEQMAQSEQVPVKANQRGMVVQPSSPSSMVQTGPLLLEPVVPALPPLYRSLAVYPGFYPRQFNTPQPNMATDGSLSMNCRVGGLKYSNMEASSLSPTYSNLGYRLPQPTMLTASQNTYKSPLMDYNSYPLWAWDSGILYNGLQDSSMISMDMKGRDVTGGDQMTYDEQVWNSNYRSDADVDSVKTLEEYQRKLKELKKQIDSMPDPSQSIYSQKSTQTGPPQQNSTQNQPKQNQPQSQQQQQPPQHQQSSQLSNEPMQSTSSNQQPQGKSHIVRNIKKM